MDLYIVTYSNTDIHSITTTKNNVKITNNEHLLNVSYIQRCFKCLCVLVHLGLFYSEIP